MTEENTNQVGQKGTGQEMNEPSKSEQQRAKDLADKLIEQEKRHALEMEEAQNKAAKLQKEKDDLAFEAGLVREASKYPHAEEFRKDIKAYVEKGLSVAEATKLVLLNNDKLVTSEQRMRSEADSNSQGGSAVTANPTGESDPTKMTQAERRKALEDLEKDGRFGIKDNSIFTG